MSPQSTNKRVPMMVPPARQSAAPEPVSVPIEIRVFGLLSAELWLSIASLIDQMSAEENRATTSEALLDMRGIMAPLDIADARSMLILVGALEGYARRMTKCALDGVNREQDISDFSGDMSLAAEAHTLAAEVARITAGALTQSKGRDA